MQLFSQEQYQQLLDNGKPENKDKNHAPVVHLYLPCTACEWLLSEIDPEEPRIAFGLCDLGKGFPELGYVDLEELQSVKVPPFGFTVTNNHLFEGKYPMSVYAAAARHKSAITRDDALLSQFYQAELNRNKAKLKHDKF